MILITGAKLVLVVYSKVGASFLVILETWRIYLDKKLFRSFKMAVVFGIMYAHVVLMLSECSDSIISVLFCLLKDHLKDLVQRNLFQKTKSIG